MEQRVVSNISEGVSCWPKELPSMWNIGLLPSTTPNVVSSHCLALITPGFDLYSNRCLRVRVNIRYLFDCLKTEMLSKCNNYRVNVLFCLTLLIAIQTLDYICINHAKYKICMRTMLLYLAIYPFQLQKLDERFLL